MAKKLLLVFALAAISGGCSHSVHQMYVSSMDKSANYNRGKWVSASDKDFIILGFKMNSGYVERAYQKLQHTCPTPINQVTVEHVTSYFFLSYDQKLILRGFCT